MKKSNMHTLIFMWKELKFHLLHCNSRNCLISTAQLFSKWACRTTVWGFIIFGDAVTTRIMVDMQEYSIIE